MRRSRSAGAASAGARNDKQARMVKEAIVAKRIFGTRKKDLITWDSEDMCMSYWMTN